MLISNFSNVDFEAGTDEAGRGCLAGPVVAAAVILPKNFKNDLLNDSKQLTEKNRNTLKKIIEDQALAYAVNFVWQQEVDEINVLQASIKAMNRAIIDLKIKPEFIIVDGNKFKTNLSIPFKTIVKGDSKYASIAAASILAKTYRDEYMQKIAGDFPDYHWQQNKGYPTTKHREAILKFGVTQHHRKSFKLLPTQIQLNFD
ncbi:MAG: ribonuclease HII [Polaribacter sp.]|nr:ribonuclease HII [Polaribacter sp.]